MRMRLAALIVLCSTGFAITQTLAQTTVRVGWCSRTISSAVAPFAIATKMGWFAKDGIKVELIPLPGSTDCIKFVATGEISSAVASLEPYPPFARRASKRRSSTPRIKVMFTASRCRRTVRSTAWLI